MSISLGNALDEAGRALCSRSACILGVEDGGSAMASAAAHRFGLSVAVIALEPIGWHGLAIGVVGNLSGEAVRSPLVRALGITAIDVALAAGAARRALRRRCHERGLDHFAGPLRDHAVLVVIDHPLPRQRVRQLAELLRASRPAWIGIVSGVADDAEAERMLSDLLHRYDGSWAVSPLTTPEPAYADAV